MVKIVEKSRFHFSKFRIIWISEMISEFIDFGQIFEKFRFWLKFSKNLDFGQTFLKISTLVKIFEKVSIFVINL